MIIVGLGNPDKKYENTYHNVGFSVLDKLSRILGVDVKTKECKALTGCKFVGGKRVVLAKPMTYMNLSGEAVRELKGRYSCEPEDIIIVYDDVDLNPGALRFRRSGSGGTHNGMRNIVFEVGENIPRLRLGIGRPNAPMDLADYVLSRISGENKESIEAAADFAAECLKKFLEHGDLEILTRELSKRQ